MSSDIAIILDMDKATSVLAALNANKLPTTQQFADFVSWFTDFIIPQNQPASDAGALSTQGSLLANDLRDALVAYRDFAQSKDADNILQESIWHLVDAKPARLDVDKDSAQQDFSALSSALRTILNAVWSSTATEKTSLFSEIFSLLRISLADVAESVEYKAGQTKDNLREIEQDVAAGERDALGRDKERVEEERDPNVRFQHRVDDIKELGTTVIGAHQGASSVAKDISQQTHTKSVNMLFEICDRAQRRPEFQNAIKTVFSILRTRISRSVANLQNTPPEKISLFTLLDDTTPEQHIPKALDGIRTFINRIASIEPLLASLRTCLVSVVKDKALTDYTKQFTDSLERHLTEVGYARSEAAEHERLQIGDRWTQLSEGNPEWRSEINKAAREYDSFVAALKGDQALERLRETQRKLGHDLQTGFEQARNQIPGDNQGGVGVVTDAVTWIWQDIIKIYIPRVLNVLKNIPIPRMEYVDKDIELVLENLEISSLNLLPSHISIRNATNVDVALAAGSEAQTTVGTSTHVKIHTLQLQLSDVSFYYKDKSSSKMTPSTFTGLLGLTLPPQGASLELKIRLIPSSNPKERSKSKRYTSIELIHATISPDIKLQVKKSNHAIAVSVFKSIVTTRVREALEKVLSSWVADSVSWIDGILWDVARRREVFSDAGVDGLPGVIGSVWSEVGRLQRGVRESVGQIDLQTTGTGVVVERKTEGGSGDSKFAMGAEPQVLDGQKHGPLGTASQPLQDTPIVTAARNAGDRDARERIVKEGKESVNTFKHTISVKEEEERKRPGWQTPAFDV